MKSINHKSKVSDFFWNMLGAGLVAMQSAILLIFISRSYGQDTSGIVSIAYALAVLAFTVARYGIRNYQVTDQNSEFSFKEYLVGRFISAAVTIFLIIMYLGIQICLGSYSFNKSLIILEIVLLRMINAVEDVYLGRYQQVGNFKTGAMIMAIREAFLLVLLVILIILKIKLSIVLFWGIITSLFTDVLFIYRCRAKLCLLNDIQNRKDWGLIKRMLIENFPLCIGTGLAIYASNIPKYVADLYLDDYSQAVIAYLILPVFTVALFSQFIYTPFVKQLGDSYQSENIKEFNNKIKFQVLLTAGLAILICVFCLLIGLPVLSVIYNLELAEYRMEFAILLLGGALYAVEYYLAIPITIMHKQKQLGLGYLFAILIALLFQKSIVLGHGIMGVCILYCIVNLMITLFFAGVIINDSRKKK